MSAEATFCIYCGKEMVGMSTTSCESCESVLKTKSEVLAAEKRPRCPWCDSAEAKPILYGVPSDQLWQACSRLDAAWGGCMVDGLEPQWTCGVCHRNWGAPREPESQYCNLCGRPSRQVWCRDCCERGMSESAQLLAQAMGALDREETKKRTTRAALMTCLLLLRGRTQ